MNGRYTYLYYLPDDLYIRGCPVLIRAGALLWDGLKERYVAQLRLQNIGDEAVTAATVAVELRDAVGRPLGTPVRYTYLDLRAGRDALFGEREAVVLPAEEPDIRQQGRLPRAISVRVSEVVFADGEQWQSEEIPVPLPARTALGDALTDTELVRQYKLRFGPGSRNLAAEAEDLWFCSCGGINHEDEAACHRCGLSRASQLAPDVTILAQQRDDRLAVQRRLREEQEHEEARRRTEEETRRAVVLRHLGIAAACLAMIVGAFLLTTKTVLPALRYRAAEKQLAACNYRSAQAQFLALEEYKDSPERAAEAEEKGKKSQKAAELLEKGAFDDAYALLEEIGETETILESKLARAAAALAAGDEETAKDILAGVDDHRAAALFEAPEPETESETEPAAGPDQTGEEEAETSEYTALKNAAVGKTVDFGHYEVDAREDNGPEAIRWIVLDRQDNRVLLLALYGLDAKPFNDVSSAVTWENCSLRQWLNTNFLMKAFSDPERGLIQVGPGDSAVFLLSEEEVQTYFPDMTGAECRPTAYALSNGAVEGAGFSSWWLRDQGVRENMAAYVLAPNRLFTVGAVVSNNTFVVRPAVWVSVGD